MSLNGLVRVVLLVCVAEQLVVGGNGSTALVLHRHGNFGLHAHLVASSELAGGASRSAGYGHTPVAPKTISSEDVTVISVLAGSFAYCSGESPDTVRPKIFGECQRTFELPVLAKPDSGSLTISRVPACLLWPGEDNRLLGVLRSSHAILI